MTKMDLIIKNPRYPNRQFKGEFLVDSGATMGIEPVGKERFVLADGKVISRNVGNALYEYREISPL